MAIDEFNLRAAPLEHILSHGGTLQLTTPAARRRFADEDRIDLLERGGIAVTRQGQLRRIKLADLFELVAKSLADSHRLTADLDGEMANVLVLIRFGGLQGRWPPPPHSSSRCGKASTL